MPVTKVKSKWSSGNLIFYEDPNNRGGQIIYGEDGDGLDVKFLGDTSGAEMLWDESADQLIFAGGASLNVSEQCTQALKAEYDITASQGAWVHGVKVELTRAANIQPATGGWYGAQFVLNAGSDGGYAILNKPAYALAAIFKGSRTAASSAECNAARFETQSSGKVDDICYILANSGTTVEGSLLYLATHIAPGDSIACLNVQSSKTASKAIRFTCGSGSAITSVLFADGDGTYTNFLELVATGDGGGTVGATDITADLTADAYLRVKIGANYYKALLWQYSP